MRLLPQGLLGVAVPRDEAKRRARVRDGVAVRIENKCNHDLLLLAANCFLKRFYLFFRGGKGERKR